MQVDRDIASCTSVSLGGSECVLSGGNKDMAWWGRGDNASCKWTSASCNCESRASLGISLSPSLWTFCFCFSFPMVELRKQQWNLKKNARAFGSGRWHFWQRMDILFIYSSVRFMWEKLGREMAWSMYVPSVEHRYWNGYSTALQCRSQISHSQASWWVRGTHAWPWQWLIPYFVPFTSIVSSMQWKVYYASIQYFHSTRLLS